MASLYLREDLEEVGGDGTVEIVGDEARHAVTVGRARVGERLLVGNGRGLLVTGEVLEAEPKRLVVAAEVVEVFERPFPALVLVQALAKGDRDELAVQAATELGVDAVVPWAAARSVSRWDAQKAEKGRQRWQGIAREATKQAIRAWMPPVRELARTAQVAELAASAQLLVLEPTAELALTEVDLADGRDIAIVVGPEGGIDERELAALRDAGALAVRLGASVLRTSTAGPAAIAVLSARLGRWS